MHILRRWPQHHNERLAHVESPFQGDPSSEWIRARDKLIVQHPLELNTLKDLVFHSWNQLLETRIGHPSEDIRIIRDVEVPTQTISAFLEAIMATRLSSMDSNWRRGSEAEKDLILVPDPRYSIELKTSGQITTHIFGNRSYAQQSPTGQMKKGKSGYYLTVNFWHDRIFLIRFGWIDHSDWKGQKAATGQAATLPTEVYRYKLRVLDGEYLFDAPLQLVKGIGRKTLASVQTWLEEYKVATVGEFLMVYPKRRLDSAPELRNNLDRILSGCEGYPENTIEGVQ